MRRIRERLGIESDGGFSLIEVVVAMMIFALISTGVIYTMLSVLSVSRDSRARQVATSLAAEEIDLARGTLDIINDLDPLTTVRVLNGDNFTVKRTVEWVSEDSSTLKCGASTGGEKLRYKKVNVQVTWGGMRTATDAVRADTVINPHERINDPSKGTILVTVLKSDGTGAEGVTVTATPTLAAAVSPTDSQGCAFALKVLPNTYTVKLSRSGYVDEKNQSIPTKDGVVIAAGSTVSLPFQYDLAARYQLSYPVAASASLPNTLDTSFINTYRTHVATSGTTHNMHPNAAGYTVVAGDANKCPASNPANWPTTGDGTRVTAPLEEYGSTPGDTVAVPVPLGVVMVSGVSSQTIRAYSKTGSGGGDCSVQVSYTFAATGSGTRGLALPFGAWDIYKGGGSGTYVTSVTLDPRTAVTP